MIVHDECLKTWDDINKYNSSIKKCIICREERILIRVSKKCTWAALKAFFAVTLFFMSFMLLCVSIARLMAAF